MRFVLAFVIFAAPMLSAKADTDDSARDIGRGVVTAVECRHVDPDLVAGALREQFETATAGWSWRDKIVFEAKISETIADAATGRDPVACEAVNRAGA